MRYVSTRGGLEPCPFTDILIGGLAPDGGLTIPDLYPPVDTATLQRWGNLSYADLAFEVLGPFMDDIPTEDLRSLTTRTYAASVFGSADIAPLRELKDGLHILGLSNGPTLAFKDMAMQLLGNLFEYVLNRDGRALNVLGATSGDTGSSAEYAMLGKSHVRVFMLSPAEGMSAFQRAQMYSLDAPNIHNIAIRGVFDDCQDIVKAVSADGAFKSEHRIGTVNSINWARVAAQIVYYFKAYLAVTREPGSEVSFAVPSGNFGNVCAGHIARQMGLPIRHLVVATNENDVLDEFFRTGTYRPRPAAQVQRTSSPSMDISKASNFERFVYDLVGRDPGVVRSLWDEVDVKGRFDAKGTAWFEGIERFGFVSGSSRHADRLQTIRDVYRSFGEMVDPHTADGIRVARDHREPGVPMICLETALPVKFGDTLVEALGRHPSRPSAYDGIERRPQKVTLMDADVEQVKTFIRNHTEGC
jgi:threonine synthase